MNSIRKLIAVAATALAVLACSAAAAQACSYTGAEQVFKPWGDQHSYVLAPDGGFEAGGQGWLLAGGAATVEGNESFYLNGAGDSRSLSLPAGSSAVSPPICMSIDTPIFRLFARNTGDPSSGLRVEATYVLLGVLRTKALSTVYAEPSWAPSQQLSTVLSLSTLVGTVIPSSIQIRITPLGSGGQWQVDDVYVDPFARH
ncbi:MAG: hypothetical protein ACTHN3_03265 [Solirubrobacterales bacterium]